MKTMTGQFQRFRKMRRAQRIKRRLKNEQDFYLDEFRQQGRPLPDEAHIRHVLAGRFPRLSSKIKGQLKILAVFHHYNWEKDALLPALEKFGTVIHYDWCNDFDHQRGGWFEGLRARMNADLIRRVKKWVETENIDLIFCYLSGAQVAPETMRKLRLNGVPLINMYLNDKENFVGKIKDGQALGMRDICRHFDLCWTSTRNALEKYWVEGALPVYLPEGADPDLHRPYEVDMDIDVSFVGQCYGVRPHYVKQLSQAGIQVITYGAGWPSGPLSTLEMVRLYSRSRINLGFGGVSDMADSFCLKGRDFEIPMSGGLYLTQAHPELNRWYIPGKEIETYTDAKTLAVKIREFLNHPEKAAAIRRGGYARARLEHAWEMRFDKIFSLFQR